MGRKNVVTNYAMFGTAGANMATAGTQTSNVTEVLNMDNVAIIANWTGTSPVGVLTVQVSNDQIVWSDLDFGSSIAVSGNSGSHDLVMNQLPHTYLRAAYVKTSGVGTLYCSLTLKQVGG